MPAIETKALRKVYAHTKKQPGFWGAIKGLVKPIREDLEAVKGIDLTIQKGEIVGFLGPNGAGKTTTIKMLTGIMHPTSGAANVLGFEPWKRNPDMLRRIALVMGNKQQLWWDLPAIESFNVLRELYEVTDADYKLRLDFLATELQLNDKLDTQVRKLSLGERMKCELVAALLHQPEVVFLDEPTIGLDLVSQKRIREFLRELNRTTGCTIVLTSHYMQDVEELCRRVVVIDHGSLVFDGEIHQLVNRFGSDRQLRLTFEPDSPLPDLSPYGQVMASEGTEVTISVPKDGIARAASQILQAHPVVDMAIEEVAVEEVVRRLFEEGR
jgi:ABC-2 type transport system ATP-binding protein